VKPLRALSGMAITANRSGKMPRKRLNHRDMLVLEFGVVEQIGPVPGVIPIQMQAARTNPSAGAPDILGRGMEIRRIGAVHQATDDVLARFDT